MASLTELWAALRGTAPAEMAGEYRLRLVHSSRDLRLFAAVAGVERRAALVVEVATDLLPAGLGKISGARLIISAGELPGLPPGRGAVVVCLNDAQFEDLFEQLGNCLVESILESATSAGAIQAVVRQIERWRRFLERRREILSPEEVRGLIGELQVVERLVSRIGPDLALDAWKSPSGSNRDFECSDRAVEVKTFIASAGGSVRISNPMQLQPEPGVPLVLCCVELARTELAGCTLPDYVANTAGLMAHDVALLEDFENALAQIGYLPSHAEQYCDGFLVGTTRAFLVDDSFPRIHPEAVPAHVVHVAFSLEILPLSRFAVDPDRWIGPLVRSSDAT